MTKTTIMSTLGKDILVKHFDTKQQAVRFSNSYMRRN